MKHTFNERIKDAKKILDMNGYYVGNLWVIDDVLNFELFDGSTPNLSKNEAMWILDKVLSSEWITEQIFVSIGEHIEDLLESKTKK